MATVSQNLNIKISASTSRLQSSLNRAKKSVKSFAGTVKRNFSRISTILTGLTIGAMYFGKGLTQTAMSFQLEMAQVFTLIDNLSDKMQKDLTRDLKKLSIEYGQTTQVMTKGLYDVISASIEIKNATEFLRLSSKAAIAGATDTATSVDLLTTVVNAYGDSLGGYKEKLKQATVASDYMFAIVKKGKTTFAELAQHLGPVAGIAGTAGISMRDFAAAFATLTKSLKTPVVATGLKAILMALLKVRSGAKVAASAIGMDFSLKNMTNKGMFTFLDLLQKKLAKYNKRLGYTRKIAKRYTTQLTNLENQLEGLKTSQLYGARVSQKDKKNLERVALQIKRVQYSIQQLQKKKARLGGTETIGLADFFGNVRAITPIMRMLGKGKKDFRDMVKYMGNVTGQTEKAASIVTSTAAFKINQMVQSLRILGLEIGTQILLPFAKWIQTTKKARDAWLEYLKSLDLGGKLIKGVKLFFQISFINLAITAYKKGVIMYRKIVVFFKILQPFIKAVSSMGAFLNSAFTAFGQGVAALEKTLNTLGQGVKVAISFMTNAIKEGTSSWVLSFLIAVQDMKLAGLDFFYFLQEKLQLYVSAFKLSWTKINTIFQVAMAALKKLFSHAVTALKIMWYFLINVIKFTWRATIYSLSRLFLVFLRMVQKGMEAAAKYMPSLAPFATALQMVNTKIAGSINKQKKALHDTNKERTKSIELAFKQQRMEAKAIDAHTKIDYEKPKKILAASAKEAEMRLAEKQQKINKINERKKEIIQYFQPKKEGKKKLPVQKQPEPAWLIKILQQKDAPSQSLKQFPASIPGKYLPYFYKKETGKTKEQAEHLGKTQPETRFSIKVRAENMAKAMQKVTKVMAEWKEKSKPKDMLAEWQKSVLWVKKQIKLNAEQKRLEVVKEKVKMQIQPIPAKKTGGLDIFEKRRNRNKLAAIEMAAIDAQINDLKTKMQNQKEQSIAMQQVQPKKGEEKTTQIIINASAINPEKVAQKVREILEKEEKRRVGIK